MEASLPPYHSVVALAPQGMIYIVNLSAINLLAGCNLAPDTLSSSSHTLRYLNMTSFYYE